MKTAEKVAKKLSEQQFITEVIENLKKERSKPYQIGQKYFMNNV